jgi:hypothetical protein
VRRLSEWQDVSVLVGATQMRCRVVAVNRDEVALQPLNPPRVNRQELEGRASLIFAHQGMLVALKGRASWGRDDADLRFAVQDGVQLPQQRAASRLRIPLDVTVRREGSDDTRPARTVDLSAVGMSMQGGGLGVPGDVLEIHLRLPDRDDPVLLRGKVVRASIEVTAVSFVDLPVATRQRIAAFVFAVQRMLAAGELATG